MTRTRLFMTVSMLTMTLIITQARANVVLTDCYRTYESQKRVKMLDVSGDDIKINVETTPFNVQGGFAAYKINSFETPKLKYDDQHLADEDFTSFVPDEDPTFYTKDRVEVGQKADITILAVLLNDQPFFIDCVIKELTEPLIQNGRESDESQENKYFFFRSLI